MDVGGENMVYKLERVLVRANRNVEEKAWDVLEFFTIYGDEFEQHIHVMAENIDHNIYDSYWHYFMELIQNDEVKLIVKRIYDMWFQSTDNRVDFNQCLWAFNDMQEQYIYYQKHCNCDFCSLPELN